ncbi:MAG: serine protease, partial [Methylotenera sp.]
MKTPISYAAFLTICVVSSGTMVFDAKAATLPEPTDAFIYKLKESLVKVSVATKSGGHGFGTGVAITKDHVVTNCHVIQNSSGISVAKWGEEFAPVAVQADWKHDVCILRFEWANLKPIEIGEA